MNTRDLFELIEKYLQNPSAFENQLEEEIKKRVFTKRHKSFNFRIFRILTKTRFTKGKKD
jgi:hypothetical protein